MKALYRKYRPVSLDTVVAQDQVVEPLKNALKRGKISHAYLFCGPRGTGKTSIARIFAHEINGFKYELEDSYIDIIEIDAASNTGVDNIRDLREKAIIAPAEGKYKIYIIDEVHMLSKSAFNALLKLVEEPPEHVVFIMATTNPEKVPITITSRTQLYTFKLADPATMLSHLTAITEKEGIKIEKPALEIIVARGGGSFRDSISLLDQISTLSTGSDTPITAEAVDKALGLPATTKITELLNLYSTGDQNQATDIIRDLINSGTDAESLASSLIEYIVAHPTPETLNLATRLFSVQDPFATAKLVVAFLSTNTPSQTPTTTFSTQPPARTAAATLQAPTSQPKTPATTSPKATSTSPQTPITDTITSSPTTSTETQATTDPSAYLVQVASLSSALSSILEKAKIITTATTVDIYPSTKGYQKILQSDNNLQLLKTAADPLTLTIHEFGTQPTANQTQNTSAADPSPASKISAIMGNVQEVIEDADDPFAAQ